MKKKFALLLTFVLAFAVSLGVLVSGCNKAEVTVEISKTTLTIETGKTGNLTATASDGSELVWTTSNEAVATVDNGKVTGKSAGTATITATVKDGEASASCEVTVKDPVTFTFKDAAGTAITEVTVDRNGDPVQISATASDGSAITAWSSADERIAVVSSTGLVTGVKEGETTLNVRTATGSATIPVNVIDSFQSEHYEITNEATEGHWYYWVRTDKGQTWDVNGEKRGDTVTFEYNGGNWDVDSIYLAIKDPTVANGWRRLSMKLNSSIETVVTINGTRVNLVEGDNTISVCYQQTDLASATISFSNGEAGTSPDEMKVVITDVKWTAFTPVDLQIPTFTLDEEGNVTITDPNEEGVKHYEVALFAEGSTSSVHNQPFLTKSSKLDTSAVEPNGEYIVRIRAIGNPGFTSTGWSTGNDIKYTVNNSGIEYTLSTDGTHGSGANAALTSGRWEYWAVTEEASSCESATYKDGTLTLKFNRGWSWYGMQVFRHYANFEAGASLKVTMTITVTGASGNITVCGTPVAIEDGVAKTVEIPINQPNNVGQTEIKTTLTVSFGEAGNGQLPSEGSLPGYVALTATISNISVVEFTPEKLATPSASYTAAADENPAKIVVTDETNAEEKVAGYQVGFFNANDKLIGTALIQEDGTFSDLAIEDGTYSLKVRAATSGALYENSDWTEAIATGYVIANGGLSYALAFGGDGDTPNAVKDPGKWYYWNDQNWKGSNVKINSANCTRGNVSIDYTVSAGACVHGVQIYYKNPELTVDSTYKLTMKVSVVSATTIVVNGVSFDLKAGDNDITVYYKEAVGVGYSVSIQVNVNKDVVANNTITLSDVAWEAYTFVALEAPSIAISDDGIVTITDSNEKGVVSYVAGFFKGDATAPATTVTVVNGEELDISQIPGGAYTVKVMAKAVNGYVDSDWSAGIAYTVAEHSISYDLVSGDGDDGVWRYWADGGVTVSSAKYEDGTITVTYSSNTTMDWGLQIINNMPENAGKTCTITVVSTTNCGTDVIRWGNGTPEHHDLVAGESQEITFTDVGEFYLQVNCKPGLSGTITISNIHWN